MSNTNSFKDEINYYSKKIKIRSKISKLKDKLENIYSNIANLDPNAIKNKIFSYLHALIIIENKISQYTSKFVNFNELNAILRNTRELAEKLYRHIMLPDYYESIANVLRNIRNNYKKGNLTPADIENFKIVAHHCSSFATAASEQFKSDSGADEVLPAMIERIQELAVKSTTRVSVHDANLLADLCYEQQISELQLGQDIYSSILFASASLTPDVISLPDLGDFHSELTRIKDELFWVMRDEETNSIDANEIHYDLEKIQRDLVDLLNGEYQNLFGKKLGPSLAALGQAKYPEEIQLLQNELQSALAKYNPMENEYQPIIFSHINKSETLTRILNPETTNKINYVLAK